MSDERMTRVWDIGVRVFHWSLVVFYFLSYVSGEDENFIHAYAGYVVVALLAFRVIWGVVGTRYARFTDFIYGPRAVKRYARSMLTRKPLHYVGHNPLGGWMVMALLISLSIACWTGLEAYAAEGKGPLATGVSIIVPAMANGREEIGRSGDDFWEEIHEVFSHLTLILVFVHILGVFVASIVHRENLIRAMVTGYKKNHS